MSFVDSAASLGWSDEKASGHMQKWFLGVERPDVRQSASAVFYMMPAAEARAVVEEVELRVHALEMMKEMFGEAPELYDVMKRYSGKGAKSLGAALDHINDPAKFGDFYTELQLSAEVNDPLDYLIA